uniref:Transmembrane protein 254 n=1 Tax=Globodera rostochiensis TaxID=31243 RepID=A0A914H696_GLORO
MVHYVREGWTAKIVALFGFVLQLIIVAIPKDFIRWLCLRRKFVKGKCIVITGGASGIGHRMAELFADPNGLGAQVAIIDINLGAAEKVAEAIRATGGVAEAWNCDIVNADELRQCAAKIQQRFGHVDIVVANAGILFFELTLNLRDDELKRALDVNILGTINTIRAFLPAMEAVGHGHLVTIASIASYFGETFGMAYCPTKFAVRGAMDCLRMELNDRGLHNIKCTTICPFFVRTPMITSIGIRPMSSWIPFLSVNRCAHQIIDAVLKEKVIAFMPWWLGMLALMHSTFSLNMQRVARDFINFRYEAPDYCTDGQAKGPLEGPIQNGVILAEHKTPNNNEQTPPQMKRTAEKNMANGCATLSPLIHLQKIQMREHFEFAGIVWWLLILPALSLTFLVNVSWLGAVGQFVYKLGTEHPDLILIINLLAWSAHLLEAVCALYLTDALHISHRCSLLWFLQTLLLGFPSLRLLLKLRRKFT